MQGEDDASVRHIRTTEGVTLVLPAPPEGFALPQLHVDGVPCRRELVGVDDLGNRVYRTVAIAIPREVPSLWWREGC